MKKRLGIAVLGVILIAVAVVILVSQGRDRTPNAGQLDDHLTLPTTIVTSESTRANTEGSIEVNGDTVENNTGTNELNDRETSATEAVEAKAYLKVELIGLGLIFEPLPLTESRDIELPQPDGKLNIVHVTEDSIEMVHSNCAGQDCVLQGIVTLENRDSRALQNMIICLPNQVVLELLTPEEAEADMAAYAAGE